MRLWKASVWDQRSFHINDRMSWSLEELKVLINTLVNYEKKNPLKLEAKAIQFLLELYSRDLGIQDIDLY